jgi:hypothetical protein
MLEAGGGKNRKVKMEDQDPHTTGYGLVSGVDDGAVSAHIEELGDQGFQCRKLR